MMGSKKNNKKKDYKASEEDVKMQIKEVQNEECSLERKTGEDEFMKQPNRIGVAFSIQKDTGGAHQFDVDLINMNVLDFSGLDDEVAAKLVRAAVSVMLANLITDIASDRATRARMVLEFMQETIRRLGEKDAAQMIDPREIHGGVTS